MRSPKTEAGILAGLTRHATARGCETIRMAFRAGVRAGWPDMCILIPGGAPLFLEVKKPGAEPSPLQEHRIAALRKLGYSAYWTDDLDCGTALIDIHVEKAGQ